MREILFTWFAAVLRMSLTGSFVCLAVCVLRLILKRAPKIFAYGLWALVFLRFVCPAALSSPSSVIPRWDARWELATQTSKERRGQTDSSARPEYSTEYFRQPEKTGEENKLPLGGVSPAAAAGAGIAGGFYNADGQEGLWPDSAKGAKEPTPTGIFLAVAWLGGTMILLLRQLIRSVRFQRRLGAVCPDETRICEVNGLRTPFVMGIVKPRIYLPQGLSGEERDFVLLHESIHIRRRDYLIKPFCAAVVCVHWFNPLAWLSWHLMCMDMELSCDEAVLRQLPGNQKRAYAQSLLSFADGNTAVGCPGFGEPYAQKRIRNVLNYRRPAYRLSVMLTVLCLLVSGCLLTDPTDSKETAGAGESGTAKLLTESALKQPEEEAQGEEAPAGLLTGIDEITQKPQELADEQRAAQEPEIGRLLEVLNAYLAEPENRVLLEMGRIDGNRRTMHFEDLKERRYFLELAHGLAEAAAPEELSGKEQAALTQAGMELSGPVLRVSAQTMRRVYEKTEAPLFREEWLSEYFGGWYDYDGNFYLEESEWPQEAAAPVSCTRAYVDPNGFLHLFYAFESSVFNEITRMDGEAILAKNDGRWRFLTNDVTWEQTSPFDDGQADEEKAYQAAQEAWWASYEIGSASPAVSENSQSWEADLNHDGQTEQIVFDWGYFDRGSWGIFAVLDADGRVIYKEEPASAHPGWVSLYLCRLQGEEYLFRYTPTCYQGWCDYSYELFYLDASGKEVITDSALVSFYGSEGEPGQDVPVMEASALVDFAETVNTYMENAYLLVSTDENAIGRWPQGAISEFFITSTAENPVRLWETYSFLLGESERNYDEKPALSGLLQQLKAWCESNRLPYTE